MEPRALLSAVTADLAAPFAAVVEAQHFGAHVPAEMSLIQSTNHQALTDVVFDHAVAPSGAFGGDAGLASLSLDLSLLGNSTSPSAASVLNSPAGRFFPMDVRSFWESSAHTVEVRVAETGQVLSFGAPSVVRDNNGLTINDSHGPTTYLRTTDADGRIQSRLVFVTRTPSSVPVVEPNSPITSPDVVIADAEISENTRSDKWLSRADLHDLTTALDAGRGDRTLTTTEVAEVANRAANGLVRTAAASESLRLATRNADPTNAAHETHSLRDLVASPSRGHDRDTEQQSSAPAWPIFDPTTRNLVLSVCLVGSLERAAARYRRRQRSATALT